MHEKLPYINREFSVKMPKIVSSSTDKNIHVDEIDITVQWPVQHFWLAIARITKDNNC